MADVARPAVTQQSFVGRTAFITGAAVGLGRAFATALTARGANAVIAEIDIDAAKRTAAQLDSPEARSIAVPCDVADESQVDAAVATSIETFGGIDILINKRWPAPDEVQPAVRRTVPR